MRYSTFALLAVLAVGPVAAAPAADIPLVQKMLPPDGALGDFKVLSGSLQYGKGDSLTDIYDGAVDLYKKHDVIDAARQSYMRKSDLIEVTIHTVKSREKALEFLKYWQKELKAKRLTKKNDVTSFALTSPNVMTYLVLGRYFATVIAYYQPSVAQKEMPALVQVVEKRIRLLSRPPN